MGRRRFTPRRRALSWLAALCLLAVLAGCGTDTRVPPRPATNTHTFALLSRADVNRTRPGTPERTVMTWWRLAQLRVVDDSLALFTPAARARLEHVNYRALLLHFLGLYIQAARPEVQRVEHLRPDRALVTLRITLNSPVGRDLVRKTVEVLAFTLERSRGRWLLSDPSWMIDVGLAERDRLRAPSARGTRRGGP